MNIVVTGAANGIGAAITEAAASGGHSVVAADLDMAALEMRWQGNKSITPVALDVTSAEAWTALAQQFEQQRRPIDVLINVAGVLRSGPAGELAAADVHLMIDVNVKGAIFGTNALAPAMIKRKSGHIINVGSIAALFPTPGTTVYAASKFAVRGFSLAAAGDLKPHGVAVTLFGPGPVRTAMLELQRGDANAALTFSRRRALTPDEVASAILGPVMKKRPLEYYLPWSDGLLGKLCNCFPRIFFSQLKRARKRGAENFGSDAF